jgi:L-methionine (R)-S-oxide reductase
MTEPRIAPADLLSKEARYIFLLKEIRALIEGESDLIANLANITSVLKNSFDAFSWVGFYLLKEGDLVLGPFQGKPACIRIALGKGVCGTSATSGRTIIVPDVRLFPGHIFCDPGTLSEIVVPLKAGGKVLGVLDIDSYQINTFDEVDQQFLEELSGLISR